MQNTVDTFVVDVDRLVVKRTEHVVVVLIERRLELAAFQSKSGRRMLEAAAIVQFLLKIRTRQQMIYPCVENKRSNTFAVSTCLTRGSVIFLVRT